MKEREKGATIASLRTHLMNPQKVNENSHHVAIVRNVRFLIPIIVYTLFGQEKAKKFTVATETTFSKLVFIPAQKSFSLSHTHKMCATLIAHSYGMVWHWHRYSHIMSLTSFAIDVMGVRATCKSQQRKFSSYAQLDSQFVQHMDQLLMRQSQHTESHRIASHRIE